MMELAVGMLAVAIVFSAIFGFLEYIVRSLDSQRELRAKAGTEAMTSSGFDGSYSSATESGTVKVEPFAAEYVFGEEEFKIKEQVHIPAMKGMIE